MKSDIYQLITDRIIGLLEAGTIPWRKSWSGPNQLPQNLVSRKPYRGINLFLLLSAGYESPFWLTFRQAEDLGGRVKKGEKSFPVVFWKLFEDDEHGETRTIPFIRYHCAFNVAQCEGIEVPGNLARPAFQPIEECERVVREIKYPPEITHGHSAPCYSPLDDMVMMPSQASFSPPEAYYSVLFHELIHSTGHPTRLARKRVGETNAFGSDPYSREELIAEMGASFLCGHCGIENATLAESASYIHHWLEKLKGDRKLVVKAAGDAQRAADFIRNVVSEESLPPAGYLPKEFKVTALRDCPIPEEMMTCETPQDAIAYWDRHIATSPYFNPECECLIVLVLNTRRRIKGHQLVTIGTLDSLLVHPREAFRVAVTMCASAIVIMHNHPSGDPSPSAADLSTTQDLVNSGRILKIEVLDHVIVGRNRHRSLREMGLFT